MRGYPQMSRTEILFDLPMVQGWPMLTAAKLSEPMSERELDGGYVWQELQKLKKR